jgi:hypothetical protein
MNCPNNGLLRDTKQARRRPIRQVQPRIQGPPSASEKGYESPGPQGPSAQGEFAGKALSKCVNTSRRSVTVESCTGAKVPAPQREFFLCSTWAGRKVCAAPISASRLATISAAWAPGTRIVFNFNWPVIPRRSTTFANPGGRVMTVSGPYSVIRRGRLNVISGFVPGVDDNGRPHLRFWLWKMKFQAGGRPRTERSKASSRTLIITSAMLWRSSRRC